MSPDDVVIALLADANPVADAPSSDRAAREQAERTMQRVLADAPSPPRRGRRPLAGILVPLVSVALVILVAAAVLRAGGSSSTGTASNRALKITLLARPTAQTPRITPGVMSRELELVRDRLRAVAPRYTATHARADTLLISGPRVSAAQRARIVALVTEPAQLYFYDWEANLVAPDGHTVAHDLPAQDRSALILSQGASTGPGGPGAGSMPLYDAVTLAAKQPPRRDYPVMARRGAEYYMFGAPGSAACAAVAHAHQTTPATHMHCLLAGPVNPPANDNRQQAIQALAAQLAPGVSTSAGQVLVVPQGTRVLQAEASRATGGLPLSDSTAQFFVVRDDVAMTSAEVLHPTAGRDQSGAPAVDFRFTATGKQAFQRTTRDIARRGANVSRHGEILDQHFAVVLDDQVISVPSISFKQYPDGIIGSGGADIAGGLTRQTARDLATQLRYGASPVALRVVP
ncbi:MAG: SecDF P1 head subdomain-containing protein [Solirubrobacteraceae bacterium]